MDIPVAIVESAADAVGGATVRVSIQIITNIAKNTLLYQRYARILYFTSAMLVSRPMKSNEMKFAAKLLNFRGFCKKQWKQLSTPGMNPQGILFKISSRR